MKIIDAYPSQKDFYEKRPTCDAKLSRYVVEQNLRWQARGGGGQGFELRKRKGSPQTQCGHAGRYLINGEYYCRKHAGYIVLARWHM